MSAIMSSGFLSVATNAAGRASKARRLGLGLLSAMNIKGCTKEGETPLPSVSSGPANKESGDKGKGNPMLPANYTLPAYEPSKDVRIPGSPAVASLDLIANTWKEATGLDDYTIHALIIGWGENNVYQRTNSTSPWIAMDPKNVDCTNNPDCTNSTLFGIDTAPGNNAGLLQVTSQTGGDGNLAGCKDSNNLYCNLRLTVAHLMTGCTAQNFKSQAIKNQLPGNGAGYGEGLEIPMWGNLTDLARKSSGLAGTSFKHGMFGPFCIIMEREGRSGVTMGGKKVSLWPKTNVDFDGAFYGWGASTSWYFFRVDLKDKNNAVTTDQIDDLYDTFKGARIYTLACDATNSTLPDPDGGGGSGGGGATGTCFGMNTLSLAVGIAVIAVCLIFIGGLIWYYYHYDCNDWDEFPICVWILIVVMFVIMCCDIAILAGWCEIME